MATDPMVDFIFCGPGKTASTWIYQCLREHPDITVPKTDSVGYFDNKYYRGTEWYETHFPKGSKPSTVGEFSQGYISHPRAAHRIAKEVPDVDLFFCIRNPIRRAFSHWWHGYGKGYHDYEFDQVLENHANYRMWAEPGFYAHHLERFDEIFDEDQIHLLFFDDLKESNMEFIKEIFRILSVDETFVPSLVGSTSNEAASQAPKLWLQTTRWLRTNAPQALKRNLLEPVYHSVRNIVESRSEYESGMDPTIRQELELLYASDVRRLSEKTGRDFSHWFEKIDLYDDTRDLQPNVA